MTDANWAKYKQLLAVFGFASGMDAMLAVGSDKFDNYTYVVDSTSAEHVVGWKALASASERDLDMAILPQELIQIWKGMCVEGGLAIRVPQRILSSSEMKRRSPCAL